MTRSHPERMVTAGTVMCGDTVRVRGVPRRVCRLRPLEGGDRLVFFEDGGTYRLRRHDALPVDTLPPPPKPPAPVGGWRADPDWVPWADPVTHVMQCLTCKKKSPSAVSADEAARWAEEHTERLPEHRAYEESVVRPWRTRPRPEGGDAR